MKRLFTRFYWAFSIDEWVWFLIWFSLPLSIRFNSLAILFGGILLLVSFFRNPQPIAKKRTFHNILPWLFFAVSAFAAFQHASLTSGWKELEKQLSFVAIPVIFLLSSMDKNKFTRASLTGLVLSLTLAGIVMLGDSVWQFLQNWDFSVLTYHQLVEPFQMGAIYFSLFLITALFQITELEWLSNRKLLQRAVILFYLLLLFLAASKIIIVVGIPLLIWHYRQPLKNGFSKHKLLVSMMLLLAMLALIPVGKRLKMLSQPNLELTTAGQFRYDSPLNGLNLRLIQWRFGVEILNENHAWLSGVGLAGAREKLNQKYFQDGLYTGTEGTSDTGYLNYNFHNQYIETLVRIGLPGLIILLAMLVRLIILPKTNLFVNKWVIFICLAFFMTESALERQFGIVYFCLIFSSYFFDNPRSQRTHEL
ncbi:MAG: O-antigen ligase family protein [Bacteroidetes bacterium]|nr:O-antigen ligase family protein [Bacteroidota bacterium]